MSYLSACLNSLSHSSLCVVVVCSFRRLLRLLHCCQYTHFVRFKQSRVVSGMGEKEQKKRKNSSSFWLESFLFSWT